MTGALSVPTLQAGTIHLWSVDLDTFRGDDCLSEDERDRARRFHFERDRRRYIAGRSGLRKLLGEYLQQDPKTIRFEYGPAGKPFLAGISFNLAHSGNRGLIGIAREGQLGVDIEEVREISDLDDLAKSVFAPGELERWRQLTGSERVCAFYRIWTRKEAYLKASGEGIATRLQSFEVNFAANEPAAIVRGAEGAWMLRDVATEPSFAAAVAYEGSQLELQRFDLTTSTPV